LMSDLVSSGGPGPHAGRKALTLESVPPMHAALSISLLARVALEALPSYELSRWSYPT
jgi:hypothetical protein